ncbi:MAG: acetylglutamate kinase [Chloroflexi bacterium AL-W]|nr:acetylglutamate kinase [Chloroflexi bacterium AL-N1]NOK67151.1 acetylglutamate kinase [Chloroflexi bacterium AL-N10]NOK74556.1 acetylglutamate kinase [Chloroflexi bacterium AL-N5]NOK81753.1 acetylglutamate kinase [Chloroflexi bacterium AL-W]NOK89223.1 acetylglutamate kinase [Chloroflexi bacterium AL-N15]
MMNKVNLVQLTPLITRPVVLKIGGNELDDPTFVDELARAITTITPTPVLVHGGGKEIGAIQKALGGEPSFVAGLRVTDEIALQSAEMVLCGAVSTRLIVALMAAGADAQGMSGVDRGLIRVTKAIHPEGDLGRVGTPTSIRAEVLQTLLDQHVIPVVAPISLGPDGAYNVNADEAAGAIAAALDATEVVFITNVPGVLVDGVVADKLDTNQINALIDDGTINGGMLPKVRSALTALAAGVRMARITNLVGSQTKNGTSIVN